MGWACTPECATSPSQTPSSLVLLGAICHRQGRRGVDRRAIGAPRPAARAPGPTYGPRSSKHDSPAKNRRLYVWHLPHPPANLVLHRAGQRRAAPLTHLGVGVLLQAGVQDGIRHLEGRREARGGAHTRLALALGGDTAPLQVWGGCTSPSPQDWDFHRCAVNSAASAAVRTWSASLSGWPSLTDSDVKRNVSIAMVAAGLGEAARQRGGGTLFPACLGCVSLPREQTVGVTL